MVVVISLVSQTSKPLLSEKCINIICCKGRNIFVYGAKEIVYRTAVRGNRRFLQVPLLTASQWICSKISSYKIKPP